jgi:outer membrane protein OmpA-like peptidoglycan-associated protein
MPLVLLLLVLAPEAEQPRCGGPEISEAGAILFAKNSARLLPAATKVLDRLAPMLKESRIRLEGHSDRGEPKGAALSLERARSVQRYLVAKGVPADRIRVAGFASTRPAAKGEGEEARRQNRRVELVQQGDYD